MDWIVLAQDSDRWRAIDVHVINRRVPLNAGSLSSWETVLKTSFSDTYSETNESRSQHPTMLLSDPFNIILGLSIGFFQSGYLTRTCMHSSCLLCMLHTRHHHAVQCLIKLLDEKHKFWSSSLHTFCSFLPLPPLSLSLGSPHFPQTSS